MKIFLPSVRNFPAHSSGQKDPYPGKRKDCTWKRLYLDNAVTVTVRQDWNITKYWERVCFDRCHITSLCSVSMAFHCWTTGYYLWTFFMQMTLIFYLYKKL